MQISRLRNYVILERLVETIDNVGQPVKSWIEVTPFWAEIRPLLGTETYNEAMIHTEHTHKIMCRYFHISIFSTMRIRFDDKGRERVFDVHGDPSNWMERDINWIFNVKEKTFDHDDQVETV